MKMKPTLLFLFFLGFFYLRKADAQITSAQSGNWSDATTWIGGSVPDFDDDVLIEGHVVSINSSTAISGDISIEGLTITNPETSILTESGLLISTTVNVIVNGDLNLNASFLGKSVKMGLSNSTANLQVNGDIIYNSLLAGMAGIDVSGGASLGLTGNILRPNTFGTLNMEPGTNFILNGTGAQSIPANNNISGENFNLGNIVLDNDMGLTLTAPLVVEGNLELSSGNIIATNSNPVIIGDYGTITGGSDLAYIEGPVVKNGRTNNQDFEFPIGDATTYAPMKISKIDNAASSFTAIYRGDPPPFGVFHNSVTKIDSTQYWELIKTSGSDDVTIQLSWNDGEASRLKDLSSTIVVGLADEGTGSAMWMNYGQSSSSGGVGAGESGTVSSLEGDPPPFGVFKFTVGSNVPESLPVELIKFEVKKDGGKASIQWKTASEINSVQYENERSADGQNFEQIGTVKINVNSEELKEYNYLDISPISGANYYRLRIVDFDGSYEYSNVATMSFGSDVVIMVAPNPVTDLMTIDVGVIGVNTEATIEVYDQAGKQLSEQIIQLENGEYQTTANELNIIVPGTYFIRLSGSLTSKVVKFMKVN